MLGSRRKGPAKTAVKACVRACVLVFTLGGLALSYEESSPLVVMGQQLSLRILPPHLPKIPPVTMTTAHRSLSSITHRVTFALRLHVNHWENLSVCLDIITKASTLDGRVYLYSLLRLYRVDRSYVVRGDVTRVACVQRASLPPVTLSAKKRSSI